MDSELETVIADFNKRWEKGQIEGWTETGPASSSQDTGIWCDACEWPFYQFSEDLHSIKGTLLTVFFFHSSLRVLLYNLRCQANEHMPSRLSLMLI